MEMKISIAATGVISLLLLLLPRVIEPIDAKLCFCQPVKKDGVATTTFSSPFSTPNTNTASQKNAINHKLVVNPKNAVSLDNIKRQSGTQDDIVLQPGVVFQNINQPGTVFQDSTIQQPSMVLQNSILGQSENAIQDNIVAEQPATVFQNDVLRQPGTVFQDSIIQQPSVGFQNGILGPLGNAIQNNIAEQPATVFQNDIIPQSGTVFQDNIIQQPSMVLQNGVLGQSENAIQDNIVEQPATMLQNYILNQPAEFALQDNKINQPNLAHKSLYVDDTSLDFIYWNSELGNNHPIAIEFNNEKEMINYWLKGKPLKVITHGWQASGEDDSGVFAIKTAYITTGEYNVITADWSVVASNLMYPMPAYLTIHVGAVIAKLLENFVNLGVIHPSDIHILGHSLGAHVSGACGAAFSLGKIGRITGLDAAGPGFEYMSLWSDRLDSTDAQFVDVIHTAAGTLGYTAPLGTVDFYPNGGISPQPGCLDSFSPNSFMNFMSCSHSRAHELFTESVYGRNLFMSVKCGSWVDYLNGACKNNEISPMGNDVDLNARGVFYLKTHSTWPYSILDPMAL